MSRISLTISCISIFLVIAVLTQCIERPKVRFVEPQPKGKKNLSKIPTRYHGQYLCLSDSSILTIDAKNISQKWTGIYHIAASEMKDELDTIYTEDTTLNLGDSWNLKVDVEEDSVHIIASGIDSVFTLNEKTKLRKYKGYLFLNYPHSDSSWSVRIVKLEHNQLHIDELVKHTEIDTLRSLTQIETVKDTVMYEADRHFLNPKRKELKSILKNKKMDSEFIRIN